MQSTKMTLTSKMGKFTFDSNVHLSMAKLLRDSIMGQYFHQRLGEPKIRTELDAHSYALNFLPRDLSVIEFDVEINSVV